MVPEEASNMTIGGLTFKVLLENNPPLVEGFQILLSDRQSANIYHRNAFNIDGVELQSSVKELGYHLYDLKIYKEVYLENNEKFQCKNYQSYGEYNKCLERIYLSQNLALIPCTPPWMTSRPSLWCPDLLNLTQEAGDTLDFFLASIINDRADKSQCPPPCESAW